MIPVNFSTKSCIARCSFFTSIFCFFDLCNEISRTDQRTFPVSVRKGGKDMFEPYDGRTGRVTLRFGRKSDVFQKDVIQNELFEASAALKVVFERPVIQKRVEILKGAMAEGDVRTFEGVLGTCKIGQGKDRIVSAAFPGKFIVLSPNDGHAVRVNARPVGKNVLD